MPATTTLVTALFKPATPYRSADDYFLLFDQLARTGVPILLFLDPAYRDKTFPSNVTVRELSLDVSFCPESPVLPSVRHPIKDTAEYMCIQLNKLRVMTLAREHTNTPYLAWIDFGAFHMLKSDCVVPTLLTIVYATYPNNRILSPGSTLYDLSYVWDAPVWHMHGTFLVGHRDLFPIAYERQMKLVAENAPKLVWEVNYWALMDDLFQVYPSKHDASILLNIPIHGREILEQATRWHPECETARVLLDNFYHFSNLYTAIGREYIHGWGSYMFNGQSYTYQLETLKKQEALFKVGRTASHVLEVGVYVGHSLLILLLSNPTLRITCIDFDARYSPKAVEYLNAYFGNRITFHLGDAVQVLATLPSSTYDVIHIDADHTESAVKSHFEACMPLATPGATVVFDDYEATQAYIDRLIVGGTLNGPIVPGCLWTNIVTKISA